MTLYMVYYLASIAVPNPKRGFTAGPQRMIPKYMTFDQVKANNFRDAHTTLDQPLAVQAIDVQ